jgi:hypothetical protein
METNHGGGDAACVLTQQLREVYAQIEDTKKAHAKLLQMIWPEFPRRIGSEAACYVLAGWLKCCDQWQ